MQRWYDHLTEEEQVKVEASVEWLREKGPGLARPFADTIKSSRHAHMKELRPRGGSLRILFIFDPHRTAILLLGGDKRNQWDAWYKEMIPRADALYNEYLRELRTEGLT